MNGNTIYVTSNFKEFKVEDNANTTWDQQSAMDSTAVCSSLPVIECYGFVTMAFVKLTSAVTLRTFWLAWTQSKDIQLSSNIMFLLLHILNENGTLRIIFH